MGGRRKKIKSVGEREETDKEAAIVSGNHRTMSSVSRGTTGVRVKDRGGEGGEVR